MEFRLVEAELFKANRRSDRQTDRQTDGRIDVSKQMVAFRNFANAPNNKKLHNFQWIVTSFQVL